MNLHVDGQKKYFAVLDVFLRAACGPKFAADSRYRS